VDFDGDGNLDLISGSYDPGELYLFRGLGGGKFAAREVIRDKSGKPILRVPNQKDRIESFGSWVTMVDWYDRGVLDILVGTIDGRMFLRRNEGTRTKPAYATENEWVKVGSKRLRVPGRHANPVIADWDGDGRWDIITGSADGGVYWYRNVGERGRPAFAAPVALIPKHDGWSAWSSIPGYREWLDAGQVPRAGIRSQIAVVDYDGDGKLDILLGDFCSYLHVKKDLTPEQRRAFEAARDRQDKAAGALREGEEALERRWRTTIQGVPRSELLKPENIAKNRKVYQKMYQEMCDAPAYQKQTAENEQAKQDLTKYIDAGTSEAHAPAIAHGYVWLFRRK
jgi:hypothetical protein